MRNFYYIQSYNMANPAVRAMLGTLGVLGMHDSLSELTIRSKYFLGFSEALKHAQLDFKQQLPKLYPSTLDPNEKVEKAIKVITVMNPKFALSRLDPAESYNTQEWDADCCGTMFCCDAPSEEEAEENFPDAWIVKYEVFFEEDIIQLVLKNGEHAFDPAALAYQSFSSALH